MTQTMHAIYLTAHGDRPLHRFMPGLGHDSIEIYADVADAEAQAARMRAQGVECAVVVMQTWWDEATVQMQVSG